jgi:hypothetical protein
MATRATPATKKPASAPKPSVPRAVSPTPAAAPPARAPVGPPAVRLSMPSPATDGGNVAPDIVELKGMSDFKPAAPVAAFLDAKKTSTINARFGDLAQGPLEVRTAGKGKYRVQKQPLALNHPAFAFVTQFVPGLGPTLIIGVEDNKLIGEVGLAAGTKVQRISNYIQKSPDMLGLAGFTISSMPAIVNAIEGGSLHFGLKGVPIKLGSAFSGKFNFDVLDSTVAFDANATVAVKGLANGTLDLKRAPSGLITGRAAIGLALSKNFSGSVDVAWDGVAITGIGKVGYKGEKFSGEVTLQMMERNQALQLAQAKTAPPENAAKAAAVKKPVKIDYVVFGEGDLNFSFTEWLNGNAHVIVDPKGNITVIGKITPQKEFTLFAQKDYIRPLFKFEARASYGIPVVGNIFIFANVGMDLFAKLGPGRFYNIVIDGTYSTDPTVAKNFSIRGSLNISAAAGARLRAEAGAGLEILSHDIKAGAGINGIAGIKAYAEATPVIGYREKAAEGQDMKGEWFVRGDLELAAQPFLGLSGDLFVEISTPWWSPLSDKKWTWPLFSKEWPLGSSMGMLVSVDYVFGSGQWPKFDLKPVEFDSNKFVTGLYNDSAKSGPGKELEQKGKWQEKNSASAQPPPKSTQPGNAKPGKLDSGKAKTKQAKAKKLDKPVDPNAKTKEGKSVKQLQEEAQKKGKRPKGKDASKPGSDPRSDARKFQDLDNALAEGAALVLRAKKEAKIKAGLAAIKSKYKLSRLELVVDTKVEATEIIHLHAEVNPSKNGPKAEIGITKWKLAEGGLKAHEGAILSSDKQVHLLTRHGNETVLLELEEDVKKMISAFQAGRTKLVNYYRAQIQSISEAMSDRAGKATRTPADENKRDARVTNLNELLANSTSQYNFWKGVDPNDREAAARAMQDPSWRSKAAGGPRAPNELRKTRFTNNKVLEASVMKTLVAKAVEIDEGLDNAPDRPLKITHELGGNLGIGYEMGLQQLPVRIKTPMRFVSLIIRVQDKKRRSYMVETGWPHP